MHERPDGYLELNVDPILWANVNAIKELSAQIDELAAQNTLLQRENAAIKALVCLDHPDADVCQAPTSNQ